MKKVLLILLLFVGLYGDVLGEYSLYKDVKNSATNVLDISEVDNYEEIDMLYYFKKRGIKFEDNISFEFDFAKDPDSDSALNLFSFKIIVFESKSNYLLQESDVDITYSYEGELHSLDVFERFYIGKTTIKIQINKELIYSEDNKTKNVFYYNVIDGSDQPLDLK